MGRRMEKVEKDTHHVERARVKKGRQISVYHDVSHGSTSAIMVTVTLGF